jgi:hypothetical protein
VEEPVRLAVSVATVAAVCCNAWAAELSEAKRKQRCDNNRARLAELELRLRLSPHSTGGA